MNQTPKPGRTGIFLTALGWISLSAVPAYGNFTLHPWMPYLTSSGQTLIGTQVNYFNSSTNWDHAGATLEPKDLQYERLITDLTLAHEWANSWAVFGRMSLSGIRGRFNFADQTVGVQYQFQLFKSLNVQTQLQIDFPTYQPESHYLALGDGTLDLTGGAFLILPASFWPKTEMEFSLGAGITQRTHLYSGAIPWVAGIKLSPAQGRFSLEGSIQGLVSLKSDPHTYHPTFFRNNLGQEGSLITGAMNPSWIQGRIVLGYRWQNQTLLAISFNQSIWGQMTPQLTSWALRFQMPLQKTKEIALSPSTPLDPPTPVTPLIIQAKPMDAKILKMNEKLDLIKIDRGSEEGIRTGDYFHLISPFDSTQRPLAMARVSHSKPHQSALKILEYYQDQWISEDYLARPISSADAQLSESKSPML